MLELTTLDILYIVLSLFTVIIWTLISIVLFKFIKILKPVLEIVNYYDTFKIYLEWYKSIPAIIKEKMFDIIWDITSSNKKKEKNTD